MADIRGIKGSAPTRAGIVGSCLVLGNSAWRHDDLADHFETVICCNYAYRDLDVFDHSILYICAMDPGTILEIIRDKRANGALVTPVDLRKEEFQQALDDNVDLEHYAVEGAFDVDSLSGAMAIGLAGWLGHDSVLLSGFSLDGTHMDGVQRPPQQGEREMEAFRTGMREYRRLMPDGKMSIAVDPVWFVNTGCGLARRS